MSSMAMRMAGRRLWRQSLAIDRTVRATTISDHLFINTNSALYHDSSSLNGHFRRACTVRSTNKCCWACGMEATDDTFLVCSFCHSVQPLNHSLNFFHIFGIEPDFVVDTNYLEKKYKEWQKKLHPDLFQAKSEEDKKNSAEQSAMVINAYNVLLKPLSRAIYMLQLEGVHIDEEQTVSDPALLMEIMEVQESVQETNDIKCLKNIQNMAQTKFEECQALFVAAYKKRDFTSAIEAIQKMTYYERIKEEIVKKL